MDEPLKSVNCASCNAQSWELLARHAGPIVGVACKRCGADFDLSDETFIAGGPQGYLSEKTPSAPATEET